MTVSECLKEWLGDYDNMDISELLTDFIDAPEGCLALFKSPSREEKTFLDGSKEITEYYNFFARSSTQLEEKRVENQQMIKKNLTIPELPLIQLEQKEHILRSTL